MFPYQFSKNCALNKTSTSTNVHKTSIDIRTKQTFSTNLNDFLIISQKNFQVKNFCRTTLHPQTKQTQNEKKSRDTHFPRISPQIFINLPIHNKKISE